MISNDDDDDENNDDVEAVIMWLVAFQDPLARLFFMKTLKLSS